MTCLQLDDDVSIIIRCKDEERWIGHAIQSCLDIFIRPQIIIVDNLSADDSVSIARLFKHDTYLSKDDRRYCDIEEVKIEDYSPGRAINLGVSKAERSNVLLLSAHCILESFDRVLFDRLDKYCGIFGKQIPYFRGKRLKMQYIWSHFGDDEVVNMHSTLEGRYFFHNACSLFKTSVLKSYPFPESLVGKEDRYWISDMIEKGFHSLYSPLACSKHHYTANGNTWKGVG